MLEADLKTLEESGIEMGHKETIKTEQLVDVELFEFDLLKIGRKMAEFYAFYHTLENTVRRLVSTKLNDEYGPNWWETEVPTGVRDNVADMKSKEKDTVLSIRSEDPLTYTNFGELIDIINYRWSDFSDSIRSKKAMQQTLSQFNQLRNVIAHSCELSDDDIIRFKLLIKDWLRIQT